MQTIFSLTKSVLLGRIPFTALETVTSTNDYARENFSKLHSDSIKLTEHEPTHIIFAGSQTAGRGRGKNQWISPAPETGLLATFVFQSTTPRQPILTPLLGLALYNSLQEFEQNPFSLKAPNDIYLGQKKLAGILVESIAMGSEFTYFIGVGLNALSASSLRESTALSDHFSASMITTKWSLFFNRLISEFGQAFDQAKRASLSASSREQLVNALNKLPGSEPVVEISEAGDLVYKAHSVPWRSL